MVHIISTGLGWLVAAIVFGVSLIANFLFDAIYGDGYYDHHKWPFAISLFISGAACSLIGQYLKERSDRIVIDKATGKEFVLNRSRHTFFFIPMHLWGLILGFIALALTAVSLIGKR